MSLRERRWASALVKACEHGLLSSRARRVATAGGRPGYFGVEHGLGLGPRPLRRGSAPARPTGGAREPGARCARIASRRSALSLGEVVPCRQSPFIPGIRLPARIVSSVMTRRICSSDWTTRAASKSLRTLLNTSVRLGSAVSLTRASEYASASWPVSSVDAARWRSPDHACRTIVRSHGTGHATWRQN
jgi:hypothetical protein